MNQPANHFYEFGPFHLNPVERLLLRDAEVVSLPPKVFDLLLLLVRNHGHLLGKEEMIRAIWPDTIVEEGNLTRYISTLRQALGERHYIVTMPRRGYRFAAGVHEYWRESLREIHPSGATIQAAIRSLAVLPFHPLSAEECDARLGLRVADAVITRLSAFGRLIVRPTSVVRKFDDPGHDPLAAGEELKVDAVLSGSLQQASEHIRVTAQLLNVSNGAPLWGAKFDVRFTDIFAVEDALSIQLISALIRQLIGAEEGTDSRRDLC